MRDYRRLLDVLDSIPERCDVPYPTFEKARRSLRGDAGQAEFAVAILQLREIRDGHSSPHYRELAAASLWWLGYEHV